MLAALGLSACATVARPIEGPVALGQIAYVNGPTVRPLAIVEDSRCPANVTCVWAGRLVVRAEILGASPRRVDLELGKPVSVADGALALVAATPNKIAGAAIDPRDYRFTFDFQGGL